VGDQSKIELGGEIIEARSYLERFAFDSHKQRQQVGSLSGGERARVALARLLRQSANLVVLDEPTNDLDTATLGALESMLVDFGVTALVVTHDRWFLDRVATSVLAFEEGGRAVRYPGNYETYRRLKAQQQAERASRPPPAAPASVVAPPAPRGNKKKGLSNNEQKELNGLPDAIEQAEQSVADLSQALADPKTYAAGAKEIARVTAELEKAKADVERLTARWEELELKRAE